jgi:hypothetical protein
MTSRLFGAEGETRTLTPLRILDCDEASTEETIKLVDKERLYGKSLSLLDCLLVASAKKSGALIYSLDKKLNTYEFRFADGSFNVRTLDSRLDVNQVRSPSWS